MMNNKQTISRRGLIKGSIGGFAGLSAGALGAPAIINASDDTNRVGHITQRSGFLGTLGDYGYRGWVGFFSKYFSFLEKGTYRGVAKK